VRQSPRAPAAALVREARDRQGRLCRDYEKIVMIGGQPTRAAAQVCQRPDGEWRLEAALPGAASMAPAPTTSEICPKPGTIVETSLGGFFRFTSGDGLRCWYRTADGELSSRYAHFLSGESAWVAQGVDILGKLWPLQPGKDVWFTIEGVTDAGYPTSWDQGFTVVRRERITVPAGSFDTYVIRWQELGRLNNDWEATHTFWFAPEVGYFVKFKPAHHVMMKSWEATRVVLPRDDLVATQPNATTEQSGSSKPPQRRKSTTKSGNLPPRANGKSSK
jgi:hypothetical protein